MQDQIVSKRITEFAGRLRSTLDSLESGPLSTLREIDGADEQRERIARLLNEVTKLDPASPGTLALLVSHMKNFAERLVKLADLLAQASYRVKSVSQNHATPDDRLKTNCLHKKRSAF